MLMLQSVAESASAAWDEASGRMSPADASSPRSTDKSPEVALSPSHDTFDSDVHDEATVTSIEVYRKNESAERDEFDVVSVGTDEDDFVENDDHDDRSKVQPQHFDSTLSHIHLISLFAILGTVVRIYMGRIFGLDCEPHTAVDDFLLPLTRHICITSSGTHTRGGSLFTDLPTNILGSFVIGVLTSSLLSSGSANLHHPIPWFRIDHPLQHHKAFHAALITGLCGCLTTFASWNSQMVVMLEGSQTEYGVQAGAAFFGYLVGMSAAASSFASGRHWNDWLRCRHVKSKRQQHLDEESGSLVDQDSSHSSSSSSSSHCSPPAAVFNLSVTPIALILALLAFFLVGDYAYANVFYRKAWISVILTPIGALARWYLSSLNSRIVWQRFHWIPWGTLLVNVVAACISILAQGIVLRYNVQNVTSLALLQAVETGFASSLSTVSTVVSEMNLMDSPARSYMYAAMTILISLTLSLGIYIPMMMVA